MLFLINILHQTATVVDQMYKDDVLFLINILHQTATFLVDKENEVGCSLSIFYIKPQRMRFI